MCLYTTDKTLYTAQTDIPVIKRLNGVRRTINQKGFFYPLGKTVNSNLRIVDPETYDTYDSPLCYDFVATRANNLEAVAHGYHSKENAWKQRGMIVIGEGLHSLATDREGIDLDRNSHMGINYNAYIPKGAKYYKDSSGCFASSRLVVLDKQVDVLELEEIHLIPSDFVDFTDKKRTDEQYRDNWDCPIARCLNRLYPESVVGVNVCSAYVDGKNLSSGEFCSSTVTRLARECFEAGATHYRLSVDSVEVID